MDKAKPQGVMCENCPLVAELNAAERAISIQLNARLLSEDSAQIGRILIGRKRIIMQETIATQKCPGAKHDKDEVLFCPMPFGRVGYFANTNDEGNLQSAMKTVADNRGAGFGSEVQARHQY